MPSVARAATVSDVLNVATQRPTAHLRLTRRGRVVVLLVALALTLAAFTLIGGPAASTASAHHPVAATIIVQPGQTLWDVARAVAPHSDPRVVVAEITELNDLSDPGAIRPGQPIFVPAR
jgi:nucleoid-associated protein YgaU